MNIKPREHLNIFCQIYILFVDAPYTNLLVSLMDRHKLPVASSQSRHRFPSSSLSPVVVDYGVGRNDESLLVGQDPAPLLFCPAGRLEVGRVTLSQFLLVVVLEPARKEIAHGQVNYEDVGRRPQSFEPTIKTETNINFQYLYKYSMTEQNKDLKC